MNIFYLDKNPNIAAIYHCDKHVVKMILESAQMLCTAHQELDGPIENLYRPTHKNHPSTIWARSSKQNYLWLYNLFKALSEEYTERYGKIHLSWRKYGEFLANPPINISDDDFSDPPQCMPYEYKCDDTVQAYQNYYIGDKSRFAVWKDGAPDWWPIDSVPL